ncbi:MAG TPA: trypsin-like peptidase domain-containing protein [Polyangiaceae bacterium]|nr:trypsin-like peptidase domain-containing protein [Polyangiaceae bacterium]
MSERRFYLGLVLAAAAAGGCDRLRERFAHGSTTEPAPVVVTVPRGPDTVILPGGVQAPASFADLAERAAPSVVFVRTNQTHRYGTRRVLGRGLGSGFIIDPDGLILTNHHVVENAARIDVVVGKDRKLRATIVGADPPTDLAVLRIDARGLPALSLGDSNALRVGDWVLAIGNPFGLANTVSAGIISAKDRTTEDVPGLDPRGFYNFLQTDASINPGNSGGPLLDLGGNVVGVNTAINVQAHKIGYAIPINMVRELLPNLIGKGHIERAAIGAVISSLKPVDMPRIGVDSLKGALVRQVTEDGPGARAGLVVDDVILEFNGREIPGPWALRWAMSLAGVGSVVKLVVRRPTGQLQDLEVKLGDATELPQLPEEEQQQQ